MASITIINSHKNLLFAAKLQDEAGIAFYEDNDWIVIEQSPELQIDRSLFDDIFDPNQTKDESQMDNTWRSLLLNRKGYLHRFSNDYMLLKDQPVGRPTKRPEYLFRYESQELRESAQKWAKSAAFTSENAYINEAIRAFNQTWEESHSS